LDTRILLQVFLRTYLVGATFNTRGMQNVGLAFIMEPGLRALYAADPAALKRARGRYLKHYNTHPYWTPLLAGIFLAMERKIALGMLPADILPKLRSTTVYTLSALGDSFFGGSFLVMWSLVGVNLAAANRIGILACWVLLCLAALQFFKMFTFGRGYAQGLAFLHRLKSGGRTDWGQPLQLAHGVLRAGFGLPVAPGGGAGTLAWAGGAALLAVSGMFRSRDRVLLLAALVSGGLLFPWERVLPLFSM
jgi:PTS system mannose-specific IID component